jgi:hypothetical protein
MITKILLMILALAFVIWIYIGAIAMNDREEGE